jgi:hypothetical protein
MFFACVGVITQEMPVILLALTAALGMGLAATWRQGPRVRRIARKYVDMRVRTPAGEAYLGPRTVEIGRESLTASTKWGTSTYNWSGVFEIVPTPDYLFLVLPGPAYLPIPRRAFEYDEDFARFCDAILDMAPKNPQSEYP